ncbi:MAG: plastocyanin/azurin family copper-binding protein [Gaiellaceae bacterium]
MLISTVLFAALALPLSAPAGTTATTPIKLTGVTGPGFTITVKKAGTKVTRLKPGKYTITVTDKSGAHNFVLTGPGIRNKVITGLGFTGRRTATVTLKRGRYEYYCTPHRSMGMRGFITVR